MLKLKLSRSSSDLIGLNCQSLEENESTEIEALQIELDEKQYQLEKLQKEKLEEIQAIREEEHQRLIFALNGLRYRLHQEKLAELEEQKKIFSRNLQIILQQNKDDVPCNDIVESDGIPFIDDDISEDDNRNSVEGANKKENENGFENETTLDLFDKIKTAIIMENDSGSDDLSSLFKQESRAREIHNGQEFSREIEKRLQKMQKFAQHHSSFSSKRKPFINAWSYRDKFRSCLPHDLYSAISIMTPIREDKDEYDWFEERKQLLEENSQLKEKVNAFEKEKNKLEIELQETKDHNELLEFRILELEEFTAVSANQRNSKLEDKEINTDPWWDVDLSRNIPVLLKLSQMKNLTETREGSVQDQWEKLKTIEGQFSSPPNVTALLQAAYMLQLLTPISQEFALIKDEHAKSESENKEWLCDLLEVINKTISEKATSIEEEPLTIHLESKPFLCKTSSIDKSMHSSIDTASEVSDISQGGETGYSSDESIDTEDIYQLNKNAYDSQLSYTSYEGNNSLESSIVNNILQKFASVCNDIGKSNEGGNLIKPKDRKPDDIALSSTKSKLLWNPIDMMNRIQELETKENEAKEILQELHKKIDQLQKENATLLDKRFKLKDPENYAKLNEHTLKNELAIAFETQNHLQQNISELKEKDNLSKCRIANLERERDKLRSEATQLLQLINSCKQVTENLESSCVASDSNDVIQQERNMVIDDKHNNFIEISKNDSSFIPERINGSCLKEIVMSCFNDTSAVTSKVSNVLHAKCACDNKSDSLLSPLFCVQCKNLSIPYSLKLNVLNEIENLQQLLNIKNDEIKNKETEYTLKIEALKCDLEETVANFEEKLETAQGNLYQLQERLESLSQSKDALESNFKKTCADLQTEKTIYLEQIQTLQNENAELQKKSKMFEHQIKQFPPVSEEVYESSNRDHSLSDYKEPRIVHKKKLRDLENHLNVLCHEAEAFSKDKDMENNFAKEFFSGTEDDNLLEKIQEMLKTEARLKQRIFELENKETAYKETLHEADKIIANVEKSYQERVEELEATEGKLRAKIVQLDQNEKRLRQTLKNANRNNEVGKFGELLDRLLESEASEQRLRERIFELDQKEKEQKQMIKHLQREKESMENELQEQEAIIQNVQSLKQTEKQLRKQIEALETSECALQETLSQADSILAERENKLQNQLHVLEAEMENIQQTNNALRISEKELKLELEENYKRIVELQEKLSQYKTNSSLNLSFHQNNSMFDSANIKEIAHAENSSESYKSMKQLENDPIRIKQMSDLMETNGKLELQISELQSIIDKLHKRVLHLESEITQSSTEISKETGEKQIQDSYLHMSLELLSKDSKIESLQDKIKVLEVGSILGEIQSLSLHGEELKELKDKINSISSFIQDCDCCNCVNCRPLLHDIQSQVYLLDEIISGTCTTESQSAKQSMSKTGTKIEEMKTNGTFGHKPMNYKDKQLLNELNRNSTSNSFMQEDGAILEHIPNFQKQISHMENVLKEKKMQLENKEKEVESHLQKINSQEILLNKKTIELENMQNNLNSLHKKIEELQEKQTNSDLSEQQLRDTLLRKKQDLKISAKQIQQLEQQISSLSHQLKRVEQTAQENNSYKDRIQELEGQLQKMRESERKLHADNVHLHHKVEAQRERINSLQLIKKDYKQIMTKYDMLEKQKKIADQAITPLKNKVLHLTEKCKEKEQLILLLTKQQKNSRKNGSAKTSIKQEDSNNNECSIFDKLSEITNSNQEKNSHFSFATSDPSDSSMDSSSDGCLKLVSPRSRIPRYTALSSPQSSPRSRQDTHSQIANNVEMSPVQNMKTTYTRHVGSPKIKNTTPKKCPIKTLPDTNIPSPPSNFQITRQVAQDSLLVAWTPPPLGSNANNDNAGYQIFVNGVLHQKVRSPGRTKALLNGLQITQSLQIAIRTVSSLGVLSPPSCATFTVQTNSVSTNFEKKSNSTSSDNPVFNQNLIKQKFTVLQNYIPQNSSTYELTLKAGDTVTVFGTKQSNGFYFGEANGVRGLISAHVLQSKSSETSMRAPAY